MNSVPPRIERRSVVSQILIALGLLGFTFILMGLLVGALIIQGLKSFVDHPDLRSDLQSNVIETVGVPTNAEIHVRVPAWLTTLGRVGVSIGKAPDEVQAGLEAIHSGNVGVYELQRAPEGAARTKLLTAMDQALREEEDWHRCVTVLEDLKLVVVYTKDVGLGKNGTAEVFIVVLDNRELVVVSARAYTEPMMDLARTALEKAGLGELPPLLASKT
jgi:hypothetical protein